MSVAYPQQAVAIGGSTPQLPPEIDDLVQPISAPAEGTWKLERYQVTGMVGLSQTSSGWQMIANRA